MTNGVGQNGTKLNSVPAGTVGQNRGVGTKPYGFVPPHTPDLSQPSGESRAWVGQNRGGTKSNSVPGSTPPEQPQSEQPQVVRTVRLRLTPQAAQRFPDIGTRSGTELRRTTATTPAWVAVHFDGTDGEIWLPADALEQEDAA